VWDARVGAAAGVVLLVLCVLPGLAVGAWLSRGHWLVGGGAVGLSLLGPAWAGGGIEGWLDRAVVPGGYWALVASLVLWQVAALAACFAGQMIHARFPWPKRKDATEASAEPQPTLSNHLRLGDTQGWQAAVTCLAVAAVLSLLLIQSSDPKQVMVSLLIAFTAGGFVGHRVFRAPNAFWTLCTPAVLGALMYAWGWVRFADEAAFRAAWYDPAPGFWEAVPGGCLVLPLQYVAAGLSGLAIGVGWANSHQPMEPTAGPGRIS